MIQPILKVLVFLVISFCIITRVAAQDSRQISFELGLMTLTPDQDYIHESVSLSTQPRKRTIDQLLIGKVNYHLDPITLSMQLGTSIFSHGADSGADRIKFGSFDENARISFIGTGFYYEPYLKSASYRIGGGVNYYHRSRQNSSPFVRSNGETEILPAHNTWMPYISAGFSNKRFKSN